MTWKRLDETRLKEVGGAEEQFHRVYGRNGKAWPRIVISFYESFPEDNDFEICVSKKRKCSEWWEPSPLPKELIPELIDMLNEYQKNSKDPICMPDKAMIEGNAMRDAAEKSTVNKGKK